MSTYIEVLRREIERQYRERGSTGCGNSFGELLCYELHERNQTFVEIAENWGIELATLGALIADHCARMAPMPEVKDVVRYDQIKRDGGSDASD